LRLTDARPAAWVNFSDDSRSTINDPLM
jgi:hypothetical protein